MLKLYPNYEKSLINLSSSILKEFGIECRYGTLRRVDKLFREEKYKNIIVLFYSGLGTRMLDRNLEENSFLLTNRMSDLTSVFPSTSVSATTSFLSAKSPYEHGILGENMYFNDLGKTVNVITGCVNGTDEVISKEFLKENLGYESIIDKINATGENKAYGIFPFGIGAYESRDEAYNRILNLSKNSGKKLIYAYFEEPNYSIRDNGIIKDKAHDEIVKIEEETKKLCSELQDSIIFITADHGNVNCSPIVLKEHSLMYELIDKTFYIENRCVGIKVREGYKEKFRTLFEEKLGDYFLLMNYNEAIDNKMFGDGIEHKYLKDLPCDFIAVSVDKYYLVNEENDSICMASCSGLTEKEMLVPLIVVKKKPFKDGIRRVVESDYKVVFEILADCHKFMYRNRKDIFMAGPNFSRSEFNNYCDKNKPDTCYVYTISDEIVGLIRIKYNMLVGYGKFTSFSYIEIENIYVKEEYRGRGIGTELVNYVIFLAKKRRVKRVEFCAWHFDKKTAKFIEKFSSRVLTKIFEIDSF